MSYRSSFKHGYPMRTSPDIFRTDRNYLRISSPDMSGSIRSHLHRSDRNNLRISSPDMSGSIRSHLHRSGRNNLRISSPDIPGSIKSQLYEPKRRETPDRDSDRGWSKYGLLRTGTNVKVPERDKAKLMYYVACLCSVLDLTNVPNISRMCDFSNYYMLREQETDDLLLMCYRLNPDLFIGKCIFKDEDICPEIQNEFYELSYFQRKFAMSPTVTVLGEPRRVLKVMFFKLDFLKDNYYYPMLSFKTRVSEVLMFESQDNNYRSRGSYQDLHQDIDQNENRKSKTCVIL